MSSRSFEHHLAEFHAADGPKLIVHAGQMKTGTTTIQTALSAARKALGAQDVLYPKSRISGIGHHELATLVNPADTPMPFVDRLSGGREKGLTAARALLDEVGAWLRTCDTGTAVLSTEVLSTRSNDGQAQALKEALSAIDAPIALVLYVRSPIEGMVSRMQQSLAGSAYMTRPQWQLGLRGIRAFHEAFGDRLFLRKFARPDLVGGDIVSDFVATFLPGTKMPTPKTAKPLEKNRSMSAEAMEILQRVKIEMETRGMDINGDLASVLFAKLKKADRADPDHRPPKIREDLLRPLMRLQKDALPLRDEFAISFDDVDYDEVGKPTDLDLEDLRIVRNLCHIDDRRLATLATSLNSDWGNADMTHLMVSAGLIA